MLWNSIRRAWLGRHSNWSGFELAVALTVEYADFVGARYHQNIRLSYEICIIYVIIRDLLSATFLFLICTIVSSLPINIGRKCVFDSNRICKPSHWSNIVQTHTHCDLLTVYSSRLADWMQEPNQWPVVWVDFIPMLLHVIVTEKTMLIFVQELHRIDYNRIYCMLNLELMRCVETTN